MKNTSGYGLAAGQPKGQHFSALAITALAVLTLAFLFGGASRQHELRLAFVELASVPALLLAILALSRRDDLGQHQLILGLLAATCLIPLVQLIPLPPQLWTSFPGREQLGLALATVGIPEAWAPLSLTPDRTWRSWLALIPPVAMFLAVLAWPPRFRLTLFYFILAGALIAIVLGAAQLVSGGERLYPWRTTDAGNVVGFFANRNHLATLCLMSLPIAAVLGARGTRQRGSLRRVFLPWLSVVFIALMVVALGVIRSRAGIALVGPVLGASLLAAWIAAGRGRPGPLLIAMLSAASAAVLAIAIFALGPLLVRFDTPGVREGRFENWPIVVEAAESYLPAGSGIGSFDAVYRSVEPLEQVDPTFFNQAHNDYLELLLEGGIPAVILMLIFALWFVRRSWLAWTAEASTDRDLQRAASIGIAIVLAHSAVDYPIRTASIATIFAALCAVLELSRKAQNKI